MLSRPFLFTINLVMISVYYCDITSISLTRKFVKLSNMNEKLRYLETKNELEINNSYKNLDVPLSNYKNVQYYGSIYLGSNKQELNVMFDTSSNYLIIPSITCINCRKFTKKFDSSLSDSYQNLTAVKSIQVITINI